MSSGPSDEYSVRWSWLQWGVSFGQLYSANRCTSTETSRRECLPRQCHLSGTLSPWKLHQSQIHMRHGYDYPNSIFFLSRVIPIFVPKCFTNGGHLEYMQINPLPRVRLPEIFFWDSTWPIKAVKAKNALLQFLGFKHIAYWPDYLFPPQFRPPSREGLHSNMSTRSIIRFYWKSPMLFSVLLLFIFYHSMICYYWIFSRWKVNFKV